jgi:hypothetical protein
VAVSNASDFPVALDPAPILWGDVLSAPCACLIIFISHLLVSFDLHAPGQLILSLWALGFALRCWERSS